VTPDWGGGSILLDRRKEKADWAFWAERLLGLNYAAGASWPGGPESNKILFEYLFEFWNLARLWKFVQRDLGGIFTWGFFLKSSSISKYFRKNEICHAMICHLRQN
jgi:hypothetical protein